MKNAPLFQHILVATDFSPHSDASLKQAMWLARQTKSKIVLTHVLPNLQQALLSASPDAQVDVILGEGDKFQREIREDSDSRMRAMIARLDAPDIDIGCETLLGDPWIAIIHAVQQEHHDLVVVGTKGQSAWQKILLGSTTTRLIRNCPSAVWAVNAKHVSAPTAVLVATDFSDVSRKAVIAGRQIARKAGAQFHLLHVIDSQDLPEGVIERLAPGGLLREEINTTATDRLAKFIKSFDGDLAPVHSHLSWGIPAQEITRLVDHLKIDLLVLGTVGRSGITGVLLGNTAEKLLGTCHCDILTVKPDGFNSPVEPPFWPLHPASQIKSDG